MNYIEKAIEIIKEEKGKYKFIKKQFSDGKDGRCTNGLLLSHFGWNGERKADDDKTAIYSQEVFEKKVDELGSSQDITINTINDECNSYDEVIKRLEESLGR